MDGVAARESAAGTASLRREGRLRFVLTTHRAMKLHEAALIVEN